MMGLFQSDLIVYVLQYTAVKTQLSQTEKSLKQHKQAMKELSLGKLPSYEPRLKKNCLRDFRPVQPLNMVKGLTFWIKEIEGLYYLCSENKDADQLHGYSAADLHLFFFVYAKVRFSNDAAHTSLDTRKPVF